MAQIAFNKNIFGFAPGTFQQLPAVGPQKSLTVNVPVVYSEAHLEGAQPSSDIQIAIQITGRNTIFFTASTGLELILVPADQGGKATKEQFMQAWQATDESHELTVDVQNPRIDSLNVARLKMQEKRLFFTAKREGTAFFTGKTIQGDNVLAFLALEGAVCQVGVRMLNHSVSPVILELIRQVVA
jgi:hypothetical protein